MRKIILSAWVVMGTLVAQAALVVDLSGNYNTSGANISFVKPTEITSGEARIYDNDFGTAIVTTGAGSGAYVGPTMYAAARHSVAGGPPDTFTTSGFRMQNDVFSVTPPGTLTGAATFDYVIVVKKADFANGLNTGSIGFDSTSSFAMTTTTYNANTKSLRAVVQNGSTWYISQTQNTGNRANGVPLTILTDAASALWAEWNPLASIDADTLDFSTTVPGSTFKDIQAVGIYSHQTKTATPPGTAFANTISSIQIGAVAVPEPATVGMLGLGAVITLLLRRMRS